jgi:chloramphenicol-sensitive protein RarD
MKKHQSLLMVLFAYVVWGIQPLYWNLFEGVSIEYIMAHRIIWSVVFVMPLVVFTGKMEELKAHFKNFKAMAISTIAAVLIGLNWSLNVYAASTRQVVEASLGHYIAPVVTIFIGALILKEELPSYKKIAVGLTLIAVTNLVLTVGRLPILAILLIVSFVGYTYVKKVNPADVMIAFIAELVVLAPIALAYLLIGMQSGTSFFYTGETKDILLLISTGGFTGYTLLFYSKGVKGIDFSNLGFVQYLAPSISLIIGIFVFKEQFTSIHLLSFSIIWVAILIVIIAPLRKRIH